MATFLVVLKSNSALLLVKREGCRAEGYRTEGRKGPNVDFFRDYEIALGIMSRYMPLRPAQRPSSRGAGCSRISSRSPPPAWPPSAGTGKPVPNVAAIQITTDNTVLGGQGGAGVHTECIS